MSTKLTFSFSVKRENGAFMRAHALFRVCLVSLGNSIAIIGKSLLALNFFLQKITYFKQ